MICLKLLWRTIQCLHGCYRGLILLLQIHGSFVGEINSLMICAAFFQLSVVEVDSALVETMGWDSLILG